MRSLNHIYIFYVLKMYISSKILYQSILNLYKLCIHYDAPTTEQQEKLRSKGQPYESISLTVHLIKFTLHV